MKQVWIVLLVFSTLLFSCGQTKNSNQIFSDLIERVFVANIAGGQNALNEYLRYHENVWPEVEAGFKKAGYIRIVLYRFDHLLVMTATVPRDADINAMGKLAESYSPRCVEWNKLMSNYQTGVAGTSAGQTWVEAKPFYSFLNQ